MARRSVVRRRRRRPAPGAHPHRPGAPAVTAPSPAARAAALIASHGTRDRHRRRRLSLFVVRERAESGLGDRFGDRAARRHRRVVSDEQALPHDVGRGALDTAQGAEPARQQLGLVLAAQTLDPEGGFRVVDADGALSRAGHGLARIDRVPSRHGASVRVTGGPPRCAGGLDRAGSGCASRRAGSRPGGRRGGRGRCANCAAAVTGARPRTPRGRRRAERSRRRALRGPAHRRGGPASDRQGRRRSPPVLRRRARRGADLSRRGERPGREARCRRQTRLWINMSSRSYV